MWARVPVVALFVELVAASWTEAGWNQWTTMGPGGNPVSVAIDPLTPAILYTARSTQASVYKSTDGGAHWTPSHVDPAVFSVTAVAVDPQTPTTVYAGAVGEDVWGVFKSTDAGLHWSPSYAGFGPAPPGSASIPFINSLVVDPRNPATVYAGTSAGVFKSTDAGGVWSAQNIGLPDRAVWAFAIDSQNPSTLYVATTAGVFKSTDGGVHWMFSGIGLPQLFFGTEPQPSIASLTVDPHDPTTVYAGTLGGVYKSTDRGGHWNFSMSGVHFIGSHVSAVVVDPRTPGMLYAATAGGGMFRSTDSAQTWTPFNAGVLHSYLTGLTVSPSGACLHAAGLSDVFSLVTRPDPCAAPVNLAISVNQPTFDVGQMLSVSVGLLNLGDSGAVDIYFGVFVPDDSHTIAFFTGVNTFALGTLADFASYRPIATGVPLTSTFVATVPDVFSYRWTGAEPPGTYAFVFYAVRAGALADGDLTADELLADATTAFSFASP